MPLDKFLQANRAKNQVIKTSRDKVYLEIVRKLNEQGMGGEEKNTRILVDCKAVGIVLIHWGAGGWKKEWFDKTRAVAELVDEKTLRALIPKKTP